MVDSLPSIQECQNVCTGCQMGKQHQHPFDTDKSWRAKGGLDLVHVDLYGPMKTPTMEQSISCY
jgi:hypothetical protein